MKLSIIIVNYNTQKLLEGCLTELYKNYRLYFTNRAFEIIVVDNASTDESMTLLPEQFDWVKYIRLDTNTGFAAANNIGVKQSRGENILFLNPDTVVPKETLTETLTVLGSEKEIAVVTCKVLLPNGKIDDASHRGFPTPWRALTHFLGLGTLFPTSSFLNGYHLGYTHMNVIHDIDACAGAFLLIKKQVGVEVGWFDEDYFWYGDDLDLCFRVKQKGYRVLFVPQVTIIHYKGAASGIKKNSQHISTANSATKKLATKARFDVMRIFYKKHYQSRYPRFLTNLILLSIIVKQKITEWLL